MSRLRALAYGLPALVVFVTAALLTAVVVAVPAPLDRRRRICQRAIRWVFTAVGIRVRVSGIEHVPDEPAIVVCNHASMIDGLIVFSRLPDRFTFVVRAESRRTPIFGYLLDRSGVIWLSRGEARSGARTLRVLLAQLRAGNSVTMFPEGTIRNTPGLQAFKPGAFVMAAKAGCHIVPAVLSGTRTVLAERARLPTRGRIDLRFFAPHRAADTERAAAMDLMADVRGVIAQHCAEPDLATP